MAAATPPLEGARAAFKAHEAFVADATKHRDRGAIHRHVFVAPGVDDGLGRFAVPNVWDTRPALRAGWRPSGAARGVSVSQLCLSELSAMGMALQLPQAGIEHTGAGVARVEIGGDAIDVSRVISCVSYPTPTEAIDTQLVCEKDSGAIRLCMRNKGVDLPLACFHPPNVARPLLGLVWDKPTHGLLFPLHDITPADAVVFSTAELGAAPVMAASWQSSSPSVILHDAVIDRARWTPCNGGAAFAVVPQAVIKLLRSGEFDNDVGLARLAEAKADKPALYATFVLLLKAWGGAVDGALEEGTLAELLALNEAVNNVLHPLAVCRTDADGAGMLTASDLAVAEWAISTYRASVLDAGMVLEEPEADEWLAHTLPSLQGLAVVRKCRKQ